MSDPLRLLCETLARTYGANLDRVVLFGSRARGDATTVSDFDVAVFLDHVEDRWKEMDRLAAIELEVLDATGAVIHALPFEASAYHQRTPLMHEIRREGVAL